MIKINPTFHNIITRVSCVIGLIVVCWANIQDFSEIEEENQEIVSYEKVIVLMTSKHGDDLQVCITFTACKQTRRIQCKDIE